MYKVQLSLDRFHMESFPDGPKFGSFILPDTWEGFASLGSEVSQLGVIHMLRNHREGRGVSE